MKILLIGINFGSYELKIKQELENQGHIVTYMFDADPRFNVIKRLCGARMANKVNECYRNKCLRTMPHNYDQIIVIVGRALTADFLERVRKGSPRAIFKLFLWDDVKRVENFTAVRSFYEYIYSFDLKDCQEYGFLHLPLFFIEEQSEDEAYKSRKKYDVYSAMFSHSDRIRIVKSMNEQILRLGKRANFIICPGRYEYFVRKKYYQNTQGIRYIKRTITEDENYRYMKDSNAVLDVQFLSQIGLTMRTLESLGMRNKLITTNQNIRYYDFYYKENIDVIDREHPVLNIKFLDIPAKPIPDAVHHKYSLYYWVKVITGAAELPDYIGDYRIGELKF